MLIYRLPRYSVSCVCTVRAIADYQGDTLPFPPARLYFHFMCAPVWAQDGKTALDWANQNGEHDVARMIEVRFAKHLTLNNGQW
jgi:hypothetical protein